MGPYHTGKSFLLNQVARSLPHAAKGAAAVAREEQAEEEEVFTIGRGVDPETSGGWQRQASVRSGQQ